jgi:hypothetical protein
MAVINVQGELDWDGENDRPGYRHRVTAVGKRLGARLLGGSVYELPPGGLDPGGRWARRRAGPGRSL